jgi:hypothetical protein
MSAFMKSDLTFPKARHFVDKPKPVALTICTRTTTRTCYPSAARTQQYQCNSLQLWRRGVPSHYSSERRMPDGLVGDHGRNGILRLFQGRQPRLGGRALFLCLHPGPSRRIFARWRWSVSFFPSQTPTCPAASDRELHHDGGHRRHVHRLYQRR